MITAKLNVRFNLRDPKGSEKTAIYMVLRVWADGKRLVYPTKELIHPDQWQTEATKRGAAQFPKPVITDEKRLNTMDPTIRAQHIERAAIIANLERLRALAKQLFNEFINQRDRLPTIPEMREMLKAETLPNTGLYDVWEKLVSEKADKTAIQYRQSMKVFRAKWPDLTFADVTEDFMRDAVAYFTDDLGYSRNNIHKHLSKIREMMLKAQRMGKTNNVGYQNFKYNSETVTAVALNESELETLRTWPVEHEYQDNARDLFLVGCFTGLRFGDYSKLTKKNIVTINGKRRVRVKTEKQGTVVIIPIMEPLQQILDKRGGKFPRAITNQRCNEYIKEVCKLIPEFQMDFAIERNAGKTKTGPVEVVAKWTKIGTHCGRRSFCTNAYKRGVKPAVIMKISGHSTESMLYRYIQLQPEDSADAFEDEWNNASLGTNPLRVAN